MENQCAGRYRLEYGVVMSRHKDRRTLVIDVTQETQELGREVGIEVARRFVGKDQAGLICQCPGDGDPLLFATRKGVRESGLSVLETQPFENLLSSTIGLARRHTVNPQHERDVLEDCFSPQQLEVLKNYADLAA